MAQQTGTSRSADQLNDAEAIALVESIRYLLKDYDRINAALKAAGIPRPLPHCDQVRAAGESYREANGDSDLVPEDVVAALIVAIERYNRAAGPLVIKAVSK